MERDDQDLAQWRIKVEVEYMNLHCSSSSLWLLEDGEKTNKVEYCNEKTTEVFNSHEHLINIKFKNKVSKTLQLMISPWMWSRPGARRRVAVQVHRYSLGSLQSMCVGAGGTKTMELSPVLSTLATMSKSPVSMILCK